MRDLLHMTGLPLRRIEKELEAHTKRRLEDLEQRQREGQLTRAEEIDLVELKEQRYFSKSALQELAKGKRKRPPIERQLKELFNFAHGGQGPRRDWDQLNQWRLALAEPSGESQVIVCPTCGAATTPTEDCAETKPAENGVTVPTSAPVPPVEGDRRTRERFDVMLRPVDEVVWSPVTVLAGYVSAGKLENANGLMRHVGREADPGETADAIIACGDGGISEAVDTIISHAGARDELLHVMQIVKSLNERDRRVDSDALLDHALARHASRPQKTFG
ncbi:hypothetical protein IU471_06775 [Nocardia elegans]|uniref:hypothetical protein n=1 Tax=Nocardia elegans TaxID=300029 RepID=UPI00189613CF|nr:hypothetical protein [Nocardia elegans]MBF6243285.1 hypothetical protein [Nocardia elegans]